MTQFAYIKCLNIKKKDIEHRLCSILQDLVSSKGEASKRPMLDLVASTLVMGPSVAGASRPRFPTKKPSPTGLWAGRSRSDKAIAELALPPEVETDAAGGTSVEVEAAAAVEAGSGAETVRGSEANRHQSELPGLVKSKVKLRKHALEREKKKTL